MNPTPFSYHKAGTLPEAIALLQEHAEDAKLLAGGHSLLPVMKLRLAQPGHLIDIAGLAELRGVREDGDTLVVGALTTHHDLLSDPILQRRCPLLVEAAHLVGDRQVRNRGTFGGSLAHADPAADYPASILALEATIVARGPNGERSIPAGEFFQGFLTTALAPDEVLTEVRIPALGARTGGSYQKLANQASGYAVVGVAAVVRLGADGTAEAVRIGVTGAGASATRATGAEDALVGSALDEAAVAAAAAKAADGLDLLDDLHAPAAYRSRVLAGLTRRAVGAAVAAARAA